MSYTKRLNIDDGGFGGIPLVCLHSYAGSTQQWKRQLSHFRSSCRAVAYDLPAHGWSAPAHDGNYSIDAMSDTLTDVLESLNVGQCVLVGHALGGLVAIAFAAAHPERVMGLVVEESTGRLPDDDLQPLLQSLDTDYRATMQQVWARLLTDAMPATRQQVMRDIERVPEQESREVIKTYFTCDPLPDLASYHGPRLSIISSSGDVPNALHNLTSDLPYLRIDGASHWVHLDKPNEFNEAVTEFIARFAVPTSAR